MGQFARVGPSSFRRPSGLTAPGETTDLLTRGRSAFLAGLPAESAKRKHGGGRRTRRINATAQTATS